MNNPNAICCSRRSFLSNAAAISLISAMPSALLANNSSRKRKKVILDCDVGVDDATALLFAHYAPNIDLIGIVTSYGNTTVEMATRNTLYIKEKFGIPAPVYKGASSPIYDAHQLHTFHGEDGLGDSEENINPGIKEKPTPAALYMADAIMEHPGEITVISIGPSTNLIMAHLLRPEIADAIDEIIIMGGAASLNDERGNATVVAEANVYTDPHAANILFRTHWPVVMVGLDVTYKVGMSKEYFLELESKGGEAGAFLSRINRTLLKAYKSARDEYISYQHDSMAIAYAMEPTHFQVKRGKLKVLTSGIGKGQTIFCPEGHFRFNSPEWANLPVHTVCSDVSAEGFLDLYKKTIFNGSIS